MSDLVGVLKMKVRYFSEGGKRKRVIFVTLIFDENSTQIRRLREYKAYLATGK